MNTELPTRPAFALSPRLGLGLVALVVGALLLLRLSAYGIWDPWELAIADAARKHAEGAPAEHPATLTVRLVAAGFAAFGPREWAGRLPLALSGLGALGVTFVLGRMFADLRTGLYAALVLATTPLFLLHSREMMGAAPSFLASALVLLGASGAVFVERISDRVRLGFVVLLALGATLGALSAGVLCTVLPPLAAVALVAAFSGQYRRASGRQHTFTLVVLSAALVVFALVMRALLRHAAGFSVWTGGVPSDASITTYERVIEHVFHGFAPWSAVLPVALAAVLRAPAEPSADASKSGAFTLGLLCVSWAALSYAAQSIFLSSYGAIPFLAPCALALSVALWLRAREDSEESDLAELTVVVLMVGLLIRDFAFYPGSPFSALELGETKVPDVFNPKLYWAALLGFFAVAVALTSFAHGTRGKLDYLAPYRGIKRSWQESTGHRAWLVFAALVAVSLLVFGGLAFAIPRTLKLGSLARRVARALMFVPIAIPLMIVVGQTVYHAAARLRPLRSLPTLFAALLIGAYTSQIFLPQLSAHLSPRVVFDTFNKLAKPGEPLAQHRVEGRAAAYYANGEVRDIATQADLVTFLASGGRKWAAFPGEDLAEIDIAFRRRSGRHLFIPTLDNAKVMLAASEPVAGTKDQNPLTLYVKREAPPIQYPVGTTFDGKVELLGYNVELPQQGSVGPGQTFHVTWVWRAKQSGLGAYQIFLHVDSNDQRINGDHDPVDGKYPVRLWDEGDIIIDRQAISVPATSPVGLYTMFVGLFRGDSRLKVSEGPHDDQDRVNAGKIRVQ